jgi:hypothetical protein
LDNLEVDVNGEIHIPLKAVAIKNKKAISKDFIALLLRRNRLLAF